MSVFVCPWCGHDSLDYWTDEVHLLSGTIISVPIEECTRSECGYLCSMEHA